MPILLTGATGTLGQALRPRLDEAGYDLRLASRSPPTGSRWTALDLERGTGVSDAVEGIDTVVHTATAPQGDSEAVDVRGTERLLAAADEAGVDHVFYVSIVGIEDVPYAYYKHKLAAERAVEDSAVPSTILRATQFHQFVHEMLDMLARLPVVPVPKTWTLQPIDAGDVADTILAHLDEPAGRLPDAGGPAVHTAGELAAAYRDARGLRRPAIHLPIPGDIARALRAGKVTCPDRAVGTVSWSAYLDRAVRSGSEESSVAGQPAHE